MKMSLSTIFLIIAIGLLAGISSGLLGIGGGVVMVPLFILVLGFSQTQAQGTSLAVMLPPVTFLAVFNYYKAGVINWKFAIIAACFFIVGGYLGSKLALQIDQRILRKVFGVLMLIIAIRMIFSK